MQNNKRKRKNSKRSKALSLLKSESRRRLVLAIVKSDSTFELYVDADGKTKYWVGKCIHCNRKMTVAYDGKTSFTIEHIVPRSAGGTSSVENCALACASCNSAKGIDHDVNYDEAAATNNHRSSSLKSVEIITALQAKRLSRMRYDVPTEDSGVKTKEQNKRSI